MANTNGGGPGLELQNGQKIPILGLGTWKSKPGEVKNAVMAAIDAGYRHIDGAYVYFNEDEVGEGIRTKINEGKIKREDVFYTSKLWCTHHHPDDVEKACRDAINLTQLEYFDLYLIHWPMAYKRGDKFWPTGDDGKVLDGDVDFVDTWKAMEKLVESGLCKAIGLSNFSIDQITRILEINKVPISNLQVECHGYLQQNELVDFCKAKGITLTAYSPLGSPDRPGVKDDDPVLLQDPVVKAIAESKGKNPGQILIKFNLQRGLICVPKSVTPSRIQSNFKTLDFELTEGELSQLRNINKNHRLLGMANTSHLPYYPFKA